MKTLIIVRHGNTFNKGDTLLRVGARTDLPLTEEGLRQCHDVGTALKARGVVPDEILCAPLQRTRQSAKQIIKGLAVDVPCSVAEFLTELDYGDDDGKPEDDVTLRLGKIALPSPTATVDELREKGKQILKQWDNDFVLPEGWSHLREKMDDLRTAWKDFGRTLEAHGEDRTVIAVTSNGVARFATALLDAVHPIPAASLKLGTGCFAVFEYDGTRWTCTEWNTKP